MRAAANIDTARLYNSGVGSICGASRPAAHRSRTGRGGLGRQNATQRRSGTPLRRRVAGASTRLDVSAHSPIYHSCQCQTCATRHRPRSYVVVCLDPKRIAPSRSQAADGAEPGLCPQDHGIAVRANAVVVLDAARRATAFNAAKCCKPARHSKGNSHVGAQVRRAAEAVQPALGARSVESKMRMVQVAQSKQRRLAAIMRPRPRHVYLKSRKQISNRGGVAVAVCIIEFFSIAATVANNHRSARARLAIHFDRP